MPDRNDLETPVGDAAPTPEELDESIAGDGTRPETAAEAPTAPEADHEIDESLTAEDLNETIAGDGTRPETAGEVPTAPEADPDVEEAEHIAEETAEIARALEAEAAAAIAETGEKVRKALEAEHVAQEAEQQVEALHGDESGDSSDKDAVAEDREAFVEHYRRSIKLDARTAQFLTHLYVERRLNYQIDYYDKRVKEYDKNSFFLFRAGALIMAFSTFLAAINTAVTSPELNIMIAILPALAALIAGFRQLYNWDRQASLYRDTIFDLEDARLQLPDLDHLTPQVALERYPGLVDKAEKVFEEEVNQWGKIARGKTREGTDIDQIREFATQFNLDVFDDTGQVDERKLGAIADVVRAATGGPGSPQAQQFDMDQQATLDALSNRGHAGGSPAGPPQASGSDETNAPQG